MNNINNSKLRVPIVLITDENYVMPTSVLITSLIVNKNENTCYKIYIFTTNISEQSKNILSSLQSKEIEIVLINNFSIEKYNDVLEKHRHVSKNAIIKFFIADILICENIVLYLDSDILVFGDLYNLYHLNIEDYYAGVVKDVITKRGKNNHLKMLNFPFDAYFNTGVMLMNLSKLREEKLSNKLIDYRINGYNIFMDQDAFNMIFGENVFYLSYRYNLLHVYVAWWNSKQLADFYKEKVPQKKIDIYKNTLILHLGGPYKPWIFNIGYLSRLYLEYYHLSPYARTNLKLQSLWLYKAKHILIVSWRKIWSKLHF